MTDPFFFISGISVQTAGQDDDDDEDIYMYLHHHHIRAGGKTR